MSATVITPRATPSHPTTTVVPSPAEVTTRRTGSGTAGKRSARPTVTSRPSTRPRAPRPGRLVKPSTSGRSEPAAATTACATGCSEPASTAAARRSSAGSSDRTSVTVIRPVVTVPVLSSTIVSTARVDSRTCGPRIRMPSWAPRPVPTIRAVGVASPRAQGQAMISTATAAVKAASASPLNTSHPTIVSSAITSTTGTKTAEMRSASRSTGALVRWASSTSRVIWASCVSAPTRVARTTRRPEALTVEPTTASPGPTSTGTGSPVRRDRSTADRPSSTTPSVAIFSPGRTTNRSPTWSPSIGTSRSPPSSSRLTCLAPSSISDRSASPARCLLHPSA